MTESAMPMRWQLVRFVLIAATLFACPVWPCIWMCTCYDPYFFSAPVARQAANTRGYRMEGYTGDFISESNVLGGCEVRYQFVDHSVSPPKRHVTIQVRRGWCLGGWDVTDVQEKPFSFK